jgi:hypothetical protein
MPSEQIQESVQAGAQSFGPISLPLGANIIKCGISRVDSVPLTQAVSWTIEATTDGGNTWKAGGSGQITPLGDSPQITVEPSFTILLTASADADTLVRGTVTAGEPVDITITVTAL